MLIKKNSAMLENFVNSDYDFRVLSVHSPEGLPEEHVDKSMLNNSLNDPSSGVTNKIEILIQIQNFRQLSIKLNHDSVGALETGNRFDNAY